MNCGTGEIFAREQVTAADKTGVLQAVSNAATAMRARLGESMASIQKLTTPYTNVTTASLQAFHAFSLGEDEHRLGRDFPQAASFYQEAIRLDPSFAGAHNNLGLALSQRTGRLQEAVAEYRSAIQLDPGFAPAWYNLGAAQYRLGKLKEAEEAFREELRLSPDDPPGQKALAFVRQRLGEY